MDLKKLAPWNWFKKEEEQGVRPVPVQHATPAAAPAHRDTPIALLHQEIDHLFDHFFRHAGFPAWRPGELTTGLLDGGWLRPSLNIGADDKRYTITVEVPGVSQDDVTIEVADRTLTIKGEKKQHTEDKNKNFYRVECAYGAFQRTLSLPDDADEDGIAATFAKGILTITIPRREAATAAVRQIPIS